MNSRDLWATKKGLQLPPVRRQLPMRRPGEMFPSAKRWQRLVSPLWQAGQRSAKPRTSQLKVGSTTTLSPTLKPRTPAPSSAMVPTFSCPMVKGKEVRAESEGLLCKRISPMSLPQIPAYRTLTLTQSSFGREGSGTSRYSKQENRLQKIGG